MHMFSNFNELRSCIYSKKFPISKSSIDHLLGVFMKRGDDSVRLFLKSVSILNPKYLNKEKIGSGSYGDVYNDAYGNAIKVYTYKDDCLIDESFAENIMSYILFKTILNEAYIRGFTDRDFSKFILDIDCIWRNKDCSRFGYISKKCSQEWDKKATGRMIMFLIALNALRDSGVYLVHGDLKKENIVFFCGKPRIIDFDITTIAINFSDGNTIEYINESISSKSRCSDYQLYNLVDLVIFTCSISDNRMCLKMIENRYRKVSGDKENFYDIAYKNFVGMGIEFTELINYLYKKKEV